MIKIGIVGYGNLGKGVECAIRQNPDLCLQAVFTRRDPKTVTILTPEVPVLSMDDLPQWKGRIDVLILCGGSAKDLPCGHWGKGMAAPPVPPPHLAPPSCPTG